MNAGSNYSIARAQAQANANRDGEPRTLHQYNGVWWIGRQDPKFYLTPQGQTWAGVTYEIISPETP